MTMPALLALPPARDYAPYAPGRPLVALDLNPLDLTDWLEIDEHLPANLAEKRRLLAERPGEVLAALPEAGPGAAETLAVLIDHLLLQFPAIYQRRGGELMNRATGEVWPLTGSAMPPLELAGRLVQEDLCLLGRDAATGHYRLTAASLCFPSRWVLAEKLGRPLDAIHQPVPTYAERLGARMNRLFDRLVVEKPVWRLNWSVIDDPALFQPTLRPRPAGAPPITAANAGDWLYLRIERQTLRRLPLSGDILFTIHIYSRPLSHLAHQPERAARLAGALRHLEPPMKSYKAMQPYLDAAIGWLEQAAGTH